MRRRVDVLLAVLLPVVCALALLALHPSRPQARDRAPVAAALTTASVVCPAALGSGDALGVTSYAGDGVSGSVQVGLPAATDLAVTAGRVATAAPGSGPAVVTGSDDLAPGLVAGRSATSPLAAVDCAPPQPDQWFTAAGADATHDSVLELVNPNAGPAVADITVRSGNGVLDVPALRGVSVAGGTATTLDLGTITPRRGELSLEVHTSRGRLAVHVVDGYDDLGGNAAEDWLPAQSAPATSSTLLGLLGGDGERTLVLANPGSSEARVTLKVITPTSTFAPSGVDTIRVAPDSTEAVSLGDVLAQETAQGAIGVEVTSSSPVTSTVRQVLGGDLSLIAPLPAVSATTGVVVPRGAKRVLLGDPSAIGVATVSSYAANGTELSTERVELKPGTGADVSVPDKAVLVTVAPERTSVRGSVLVTGTGAAVVPLRQLVLTSLVPEVRPGTP